jgi:hypothetical protein
MRLHLLLLLTIIVNIAAFAAIPPMISYQGKLTKADGTLLVDGTYRMEFSIYDVPTDGRALWWEANPAVQVKKGLFSVLLGSVVNLPGNIFDNQNRYFGVKVADDPEMSPRQQIASVPFAFRAASAANADNAATAGIADTVKDGAITTAKIADGAITNKNLSNAIIPIYSKTLNSTWEWNQISIYQTNPDLELNITLDRASKVDIAFTGISEVTVNDAAVYNRIAVDDVVLTGEGGHRNPSTTVASWSQVVNMAVVDLNPGIHKISIKALIDRNGAIGRINVGAQLRAIVFPN